ncbi:hypothetical protein NQ315_001354 [Exocentrus adspersus]|uniref:Fibronectin type-III domain-containing protein n=1 Tax=Exocentrus adspersus TaxID=1586481 RepID=A0AAV8WF52_9CUCU|nr:hypothetical protein NQ315_001354 [Exocentrus adspersus]
MTAKVLLVALLAFHCIVCQAYGCIAGQVQTLRIHANANLTWEVSLDETCEIEEYQIDIEGDREDEYHFKVRTPFVDLSFLDVCEEWRFTVTPISGGVFGFERVLTDFIPLPPTADISLKYFNISQIADRDVLLEWDLNNHTHGDCTLRYRVTLEDDTLGDTHDIYVTGKSVHLHNLSPCVNYRLGIRAVNRAHPTIEGPMRYHNYEIEPQIETAPRLNSIVVNPTSIQTTWRLENPGRNRCPIRFFYADGGANFNLTLAVVDSSPLERPPVNLALSDLLPNKMYFFKVSVENSAGVSPATPIAVQTTELGPGKI